MASEAKIGLLLGLAIIFVVAFVINGLPRFGNTDPSEDLTKVVGNGPPGIRPGVPREVFAPGQTPDPIVNETPSNPNGNERFRILLPGTITVAEVGNALEADAPDRTNNPGAAREVVQAEPAGPAWPKVHVVRKGDSLGDIAKIYYGPKEGNRRVNVMRIFESNRNLLKSPDKIFPGQTLIIPSLWVSGLDSEPIERVFPDSMFERVESIGRRHL